MGIADLLAEVAGEFGVWLGRLDGSPVLGLDAGRTHYSASTMKLPVAVAMMRKVAAGELMLDQSVAVHNDFASAAGGRFGVAQDEDEAPATWTVLGQQVTLGWLATEMITESSNLATNLVLELTGIEAADAVLADYGSGRSAVRRGIDDTAARAAGISNEMSPVDLAAVLVAVGNDKGASGDYLRNLLAGNRWNDEIPAGLPAGTRVEHKNGWDDRIRHDGGIVRPLDAEPFVLAVCTTSDLPDPDAQRLIAGIATVAWENRHDLAAVR